MASSQWFVKHGSHQYSPRCMTVSSGISFRHYVWPLTSFIHRMSTLLLMQGTLWANRLEMNSVLSGRCCMVSRTGDGHYCGRQHFCWACSAPKYFHRLHNSISLLHKACWLFYVCLFLSQRKAKYAQALYLRLGRKLTLSSMEMVRA